MKKRTKFILYGLMFGMFLTILALVIIYFSEPPFGSLFAFIFRVCISILAVPLIFISRHIPLLDKLSSDLQLAFMLVVNWTLIGTVFGLILGGKANKRKKTIYTIIAASILIGAMAYAIIRIGYEIVNNSPM